MKVKISWNQFQQLSDKLAERIISSQKNYEGIIAISRGGLPLATLFSHKLNIPITEILHARSYSEDGEIMAQLKLDESKIPENKRQDKIYLIVDDISDTGRTLGKVMEQFSSSDSVTIYHKPKTSKYIPTYYIEDTEDWIVFPWE